MFAILVLAIFAAGARADDHVAFVDAQVAKLEAADKVRHQIASAGDAVFVAERQAINALGDLGVSVERDAPLRKLYQDKVIPLLIRCLGDDSTRTAVARAFQKIGASALPPMLDALAHDGNPEVRAGVAKALGLIHPQAREALPALIAALHDESALVRTYAASTLTDFALAFQEARAPLIQALGDSDVREAVTKFADGNSAELERDAPEIARALKALQDADPVRRFAGWLYRGFIALAILSLLTCGYGMCFRQREPGTTVWTVDDLIPTRHVSQSGRVMWVHKLFAWTRGINWSFSESMDISDCIEGVKKGDSKCIDFALRGPPFLCFGLSTFLAIGFGMVYFGASAGWGFVAFVVLFVGMAVRQTMFSYRMRKLRGAEIKAAADKGSSGG